MRTALVLLTLTALMGSARADRVDEKRAASELGSILDGHARNLIRCLDRAPLSTLSFVIDHSGKPTEIAINGTRPAPRAARCLEGTLARVRFPRPFWFTRVQHKLAVLDTDLDHPASR